MVFGPKSIEKPMLPMVLETKNHHKTIDINGDFPTIHSMAVVTGEYKNVLNVAMVIITKPIILCWENQQSKP